MDNKPGRLLFFDILRIGSVAMIVFAHIATVKNWVLFTALIFNIIYLNVAIFGVYLLIFVSGAVLEYSHPKLSSLDEVSEFYVKRLFRIYPAFWMSLIIGLIIVPKLITLPLFNLLLEFIGFTSWAGQWGGQINAVGWFIGLIIVLYFLFPFLSASIKKYPYRMFFMIAFAEVFLRYFFNVYTFGILTVYTFGILTDRWFPVCNFLEFGLGIWVVQQNFYPKWTHENRWISFLTELSFYIFLIHILFLNNAQSSLMMYLIQVVLLAWLVMLGDRKIQIWLKKVTGLACPDSKILPHAP